MAQIGLCGAVPKVIFQDKDIQYIVDCFIRDAIYLYILLILIVFIDNLKIPHAQSVCSCISILNRLLDCKLVLCHLRSRHKEG